MEGCLRLDMNLSEALPKVHICLDTLQVLQTSTSGSFH